MYEIKLTADEKTKQDFISLPGKLYTKKQSVQNKDEENKLLCGTHVLSKYFIFQGFVCYKEGSICARLAVTLYPDKSIAYFGFFESVNDKSAAKALMDEAERYAKQHGRTKLTGPVDASFWIKYRLKVNRFEKRTYVSEPCNKDYYINLYDFCGFVTEAEYISNIYEKLPLFNYEIEKYSNRYKEFTEKGYEIISPKRKDWEKVISEVYKLIIDLYSDFPVFSYISEEDFKELFKSYKFILDFSMVKMAYYNKEAVGFFIGMPDYKNRLYGKISFLTLIYVFFKRIRSKNYVMLYLGVDNNHHGLGKAITGAIMDNLHKKQATSIGAFIKRGKITERYVEEKVHGVYEYLLLNKDLSGEIDG